jgi:NADPH:quinone reductase-like Zn-dependent oxidoreductase
MTIRRQLWGRGITCAALFLTSAVAGAVVPTTQQAIVQTGHGGPDVLQLRSIPVLQPADGQVLIEVYAAAVNPMDWKGRQGAPGAASEVVPGGDVAGKVAAVGPGVSDLKVGEAVFGVIARGGATLNGGYSQYVVAAAGNVVPKPKGITYAEAAGLGVATITGVRCVMQLNLHRGERVLITGVAGGVGSAAAQAAIARGVHVVGTASSRHTAYLRSIGVTDVIDYTQGDWAAKAKAAHVEAAIDTVGADTAQAALDTVPKGGSFVSVGSHDYTPERCATSGITCPPGGSVVGGPVSTASLLQQTVMLVHEGKLKVHVDKTFPLADAAAAQEFNHEGHTEGKIIIAVRDQADSR